MECKFCGERFSQKQMGRRRQYCRSVSCYNERREAQRKARLRSYPTCSVDGCTNKADRIGSGFCEKHYCRMLRKGTTEDRPKRGKYVTKHGYTKEYMPEHPLADSTGMIFEHRRIMYDKLGEDAGYCFWCNEKASWKTCVIDHLNERKSDNRLDNLRVSCNTCNRARGSVIPFVDRVPESKFGLFLAILDKYKRDGTGCHNRKSAHEKYE